MDLLDVKDDQLQIDETKDWYAELVGEDKKYADEKALALSRVHADRHIAFIEAENEEYRKELLALREQATAGAKLQELLDKLDSRQQQLASRDETLDSKEVMTQPAIDETKLETLFETKIQQYEQSKQERENFRQVESKLKERYGNSYSAALKEKANELGLSDDEINAMARKNPNLFIKTFDLNLPPSNDGFQTPPKNTSTFNPKPPKQRTWSYYLDLKRKNPNSWLDKNTRLQMEKDAQALGEAFYDI